MPYALSALLMLAFIVLMGGCAAATSSRGERAPRTGPPDFGPNVLIADPSMPDLQDRLRAIFAGQEKSEFGDGRYAVLFKPGRYDLDFNVGFTTHLAGLGASPEDVVIRGACRVTAEWRNGNATCNFWRCAENFTIEPTSDGLHRWATSQGVSFRRMRVRGDMHLWDGGWSSGGFIADSVIDGTVNSGSQQQWFSRNASWGRWQGGNWNMVFVGTTNPPTGTWPAQPYTVIERTPPVREKPYLTIDAENQFMVVVPPLRTDHRGTSWNESAPQPPTQRLPIERFHIARADRDDAASINAALSRGLHLLLTPGIYLLNEPIRIERPGTIVLGIGYATLRPTSGNSALTVSDVPGVSVSSLLIDAMEPRSESLVRIGTPGTASGDAANPTIIHDLFCRVGGAVVGSCESMLTIHSHHVIGDNLWLWRADHGTGADWNVNYNRNGLIVHGDDVTMYGLFVEHQHEYQTIWNGERGRVYFYQSEMPYDPPSNEAWTSNGTTGFASYKVGDHVRMHEAHGVGVYCVFKAAKIIAHTGIEAPETEGVRFRNIVTIRLDGVAGSGINHIINRHGDAVLKPEAKKATLNRFPR